MSVLVCMCRFITQKRDIEHSVVVWLGFYGISSLIGYLLPNSVDTYTLYIYIYIYIYIKLT